MKELLERLQDDFEYQLQKCLQLPVIYKQEDREVKK